VSDVEIKHTQTLSREEVVTLLTTMAEALSSGDGHAHLQLGASTVKIHVPDELQAEIEIEIDGDEIELEVELTWSRAAPRRTRSRAAHHPAAGR